MGYSEYLMILFLFISFAFAFQNVRLKSRIHETSFTEADNNLYRIATEQIDKYAEELLEMFEVPDPVVTSKLCSIRLLAKSNQSRKWLAYDKQFEPAELDVDVIVAGEMAMTEQSNG